MKKIHTFRKVGFTSVVDCDCFNLIMTIASLVCTFITCDYHNSLMIHPSSAGQSSALSQQSAHLQSLAQRLPTWRASVLPSQIRHLFCSHQVVVPKVVVRSGAARHVLALVVAQE